MTSIQRFVPKTREHWFPELRHHVLTIVLVKTMFTAWSSILNLQCFSYLAIESTFWCLPIWILLLNFIQRYHKYANKNSILSHLTNIQCKCSLLSVLIETLFDFVVIIVIFILISLLLDSICPSVYWSSVHVLLFHMTSHLSIRYFLIIRLPIIHARSLRPVSYSVRCSFVRPSVRSISCDSIHVMNW